MGVTTLEALILRHQDDRERDRLLFCLTREQGLLRLRARGTKRHEAKLAGSVEPITEVNLSFADGRISGVVTGAVITERWAGLRSDLIGLMSAQWLAELVERVAKPGQASPPLFDLLRQQWSAIATQSGWTAGRRWLALDRMAWDILTIEGFAPSLERCPRCGRTFVDEAVAYAAHVGVVHEAEAPAGALSVPWTGVSFLHTGVVLGDERTIFKPVHAFVEMLIHQTLDRPMHADRVLRAVLRGVRLSPA